MAIGGGNTHIGDMIQQNEHERAEFGRQLVGLSPDTLMQLAEDCCFKVGYMDIITEELSTRLLHEQNEAAEQLLKQAMEHVQLCRKLATELLTSGSAVAHQTILPAEVTVAGNDGTRHMFRFSALQLALTGKLTQEDKVLTALKLNGMNCSVNLSTADGTQCNYAMRENSIAQTARSTMGPTALMLNIYADTPTDTDHSRQ